jgi:hypothetical protein
VSAAQLGDAHEERDGSRCIKEHKVRGSLGCRRKVRWRAGHGPTRTCLYRTRVFQRHKHPGRARPPAPEGRRFHRLSARHTRLSFAGSRRSAAHGQRSERMEHEGVCRRHGLFQHVARREAQGTAEPFHLGFARLRHFQTEQANRDRLHAGRGPWPSTHLVHRRPLRLCVDPFLRLQRSHTGRRRLDRSAQAAGGRQVLDPRNVDRRW